MILMFISHNDYKRLRSQETDTVNPSLKWTSCEMDTVLSSPFNIQTTGPDNSQWQTFMLQQTADKDQMCDMRHENYTEINSSSCNDCHRAGKRGKIRQIMRTQWVCTALLLTDRSSGPEHVRGSTRLRHGEPFSLGLSAFSRAHHLSMRISTHQPKPGAQIVTTESVSSTGRHTVPNQSYHTHTVISKTD